MINEVLLLLKDVVNAHLSASLGLSSAQADQGQVVFLDGEKIDYLDFKLGAVTLMIAGIEKEHSMRPGDPYRVMLADGTAQRVMPPIPLNLQILFVCRFKDYLQSLRCMSLILQLFQRTPVLDHTNAPGLSERIEKVVMELHTPPMSEVQGLWGMLRTAYLPSLVYRARMVVFQDEDGAPVPLVTATAVKVSP